MRTIFSFGLVLLAAVAAGCTVMYAPQPGEPTARLRVIYAAQDQGIAYGIYKLDSCATGAKEVGRAVVRPDNEQTLGMPGRSDMGAFRSTELIIPAQQPVGVILGSQKFGALRSVSCDVSFRFDALPHQDYEVEFRWLDNHKSCTVFMRRLTTGPVRKAAAGALPRATVRQMEPSVRSVRKSFSGPEFCAAS